MQFEQIDWGIGNVVFWDLEFLNPKKSLADQIDNLKEDLAQIQYANDVLIDVGWYPEFSDDGSFSVKVIQNSNWDEPLFLQTHKTFDGFLSSLKEAVTIANNISLYQ